MWTLIVRGLTWASTIGLGWAVGDFYNESKTSDQLLAAEGKQPLSMFSKLQLWFMQSAQWIAGILIVFTVLYVVVRWIAKKF